MQIKIHGGTPRGDSPDLCLTCRWGVVARPAIGAEFRICQRAENGKQVPGPIISCTGYSNRMTPSLHEFAMIAWELRTSRSGKIGFAPAKRDAGNYYPDRASKFGDDM
jgi:hypothetical protein